jgi:hypothetical protein
MSKQDKNVSSEFFIVFNKKWRHEVLTAWSNEPDDLQEDWIYVTNHEELAQCVSKVEDSARKKAGLALFKAHQESGEPNDADLEFFKVSAQIVQVVKYAVKQA